MKTDKHWSEIWQEIESELSSYSVDGVSLSFLFSDIHDLASAEADDLEDKDCIEICKLSDQLCDISYVGTANPTLNDEKISEIKVLMDELKKILIIKFGK
jgi:hypothetical protein